MLQLRLTRLRQLRNCNLTQDMMDLITLTLTHIHFLTRLHKSTLLRNKLHQQEMRLTNSLHNRKTHMHRTRIYRIPIRQKVQHNSFLFPHNRSLQHHSLSLYEVYLTSIKKRTRTNYKKVTVNINYEPTNYAANHPQES